MRLELGRLPRLAAVLVAGSVVLLGAPPKAVAHDSEWCGHSSLHGKYWRLVYAGFRNDPKNTQTGGAQMRRHWHHVDHHYRKNPTSGPYFYRHTRDALCGYVTNEHRDSEATIGIPAFPVDPTDIPEPGNSFSAPTVRNVELRETAFTTFTGG